MNTTSSFCITSTEYIQIKDKIGDLPWTIGWQFLRQSPPNAHTEEIEDLSQDVWLSICGAVHCIKRQKYVKEAFKLIEKFNPNNKEKQRLEDRWNHRAGTGKKSFHIEEELELRNLVNQTIPKEIRPDPYLELKINDKILPYLKSAMYNKSKRKIGTNIKERPLRKSSISIQTLQESGWNI